MHVYTGIHIYEYTICKHTHIKMEKLMTYHHRPTDFFKSVWGFVGLLARSSSRVSHVWDEKKAEKPNPVWPLASVSPSLLPHPSFTHLDHTDYWDSEDRNTQVSSQEIRQKFNSTTSQKHNYFHLKIHDFHPCILRKYDWKICCCNYCMPCHQWEEPLTTEN